MVNWFKHDIPAWMDGTEGLSDGAYRAYHVVLQLIYLSEGSIALHEKGIAGRCRQSVRAFRKNLQELLEVGKLRLEDGRLSNVRAENELESIRTNRINAGKGGEKSGEVRKQKSNTLANHATAEAPLQNDQSLKEQSRAEESRADSNVRAGDLAKQVVQAFEAVNSPNVPDTSRVSVWLAQGFNPAIIEAVVVEKLRRNPSVRSLKFFDDAIREAHESRAPAAAKPKAPDWDPAMRAYKSTRNWPRSVPGSEPGTAGCQVPAEVLQRYGYGRPGEPANLPSDDAIWSPILAALVKLVGQKVVDTEFSDVRGAQVEGNRLILIAKSASRSGWWRYIDKLGDAANALYPQVTDVVFESEPEAQSRKRAA